MDAEGRFRHSLGLLIGISVAGIAIAFGAFVLARNADQQRVREALDFRAEWRARDFDRKLSIAVEDIDGIATLVADRGTVSAAEFKRYATLIHKPSDPYSSLLWAPLVTAQNRAAFVAAERHQIGTGYHIMQRQADGRFVRAVGRDEFLPLLYAARFGSHAHDPGIDLIERPERRRVMEMARDEGEPIATPPTPILSSSDQGLGFLVFWPVYATGTVPTTVAARRQAFRGAIVAVFRFDEVLPAALALTPDIREAIDFYIDAGGAGGPSIHVGSFDPHTRDFVVSAAAASVAPGSVAVAREFDLLGRHWTLVSHFMPGFVAGLRSNTPWLWLGFGLLLTGLVVVFAETERSRFSRVRALVADRTAALASTNEALAQEVAHHSAAERSATQAAEQLARSQGELQAVLDSTVDGVITIDATGTVLTFSKPAERIFGYRADEVIGRNIKMLMPEPYHGAHDDYLATYLTTGVSKIIGIGRQVTGLRKDGSEFPMDLGVGELRTSDGRREFVGSVRDISDRVAAEEEVRRSQTLLQATFDASPFAITIRDTELKILLWNRAAEATFGYTADEVLGKPSVLANDPAQAEQFASMSARAFAGETIRGLEQVRRRKDGTVAQVRLTVAPIYSGDKLTAFVSIIEDVTERNTIERQLVQAQKMEAIGSLTGGMAHDFNNLLGVIIGNLDLLQPLLRSTADGEALAADALDAALRGADLTQRLLAFARRQPLQPRMVDLNELVASTGKLLDRMLGEDIRLTLRLAPEAWHVVVDPAQLESSLMNLATNARDAMPGGGTLSIVTANRQLDADYCALHTEIAPGDYAVIEVSDTGSGMPPEIASHIFEPFFTTKEQGKGTGLGLSMVFGFLKQSGGHISVYSEPGAGTTFRLYMPRNEGAVVRGDAEAELLLPLGRGETVLVVEDNERLRRVVMRQVVELGYRAIEAADAAAALALLEREDVDLLFTDIVIPGGIDGFALARRVADAWPRVKVVLTSGFPGKKADADHGPTVSAARLLTKPYRKDNLARVLRAALDAATSDGGGED